MILSIQWYPFNLGRYKVKSSSENGNVLSDPMDPTTLLPIALASFISEPSFDSWNYLHLTLFLRIKLRLSPTVSLSQ